MRKSMILDLAFDGDCYRDKISLRDDEDYFKNDKKLQKLLDKLIEDFPEEEKRKISTDLFMAQGGIESAIEEIFFDEGFKLGLIIGAQNFLK